MPLGKYKDFKNCVKKNQDKSNPEAYCGSIYWRIEGSKKQKNARRNKK